MSTLSLMSTFLAALRTVILVPLFVVYTLTCAAFIIVYSWMRPTSPLLDRIVKFWARVFLWIPPMGVEAEGTDLVDPEKRYVVVSNHLSQFDIPIMFRILPLHGRFLAKQELFRIPLFGTAMRRIGIIEINREARGSSRQAINDGVTLAAERGYSLIVFPEGTRSKDGTMQPFHKGAFRIAIDTGLPILPVVIEGTDRVSKPGSKIIHPGRAQVRILPPIETADMTNKDNLRDLTRSIESDMTEAYGALSERAPSS